MSDDLIERLEKRRFVPGYEYKIEIKRDLDKLEAAARIRELEAERDVWKGKYIHLLNDKLSGLWREEAKARIRELEGDLEEAYVRGYHDCQQKGITEGRLVLIDGPELLAAKAAETEAQALRARVRILEAALRVMGVDPGSLEGEGE